MFDAPMDGLVLWGALSIASLAVLGVALAVASPPAPDAARVAAAIDEVATSPYAVADTIRVRADRVRIAGDQVSISGSGGADHARLVGGPVIPARTTRLRQVITGTDPTTVYETPAAFRRALAAGRTGWGRWWPAPDRLRIRRVSWGSVNATLVG